MRTIDTPDELIFINQLLQDACLQKNIHYQTIAYRNKVRYFFNTYDIDSTIAASKPAMRFFEENQLEDEIFKIQTHIIILHVNMEEYEYALEKGVKMYQKAEILDNKEGKISACHVLNYANYTSGRYKKALAWGEEGMKLTQGQKDYLIESMEFNLFLTECSFELKDYEKMKVYLDKMHSLLLEYENTFTDRPKDYLSVYWLWMYSRFATYELAFSQNNRARKYLESAKQYISNNSYDVYRNLLNFTYSDYYLAIGDCKKALEYLDAGITYQRFPNPKKDPTLFWKRADIYARMQKFDTAVNEMKKSIQLSDSINKQRYLKQTEQLRTIYEINKLETEGEKSLLTIHTQKTLLLFLVIFLILLGIYVIHFYRIKRQIVNEAEKAKNANQNTSVFLSNLSREIQLFLQDISRISELLIHESDPEKRQQYAVHLHLHNEMAQAIIFNILDVSKIESDRMKFNHEEVSLAGLMDEIYSSSLQFVSKDLKIKRVAGIDKIITTDPVRLCQILNNLTRYLISNTQHGTITIGYEELKNRIRFYISSDGFVISEKEQQIIFDRLAQTSGRLQDMKLEMIISKGLITKMGGTIKLFANSKTGTRFEFALPIISPDPINNEKE